MKKRRKSVARLVNSPLRYVREYAPSLTVARASLLPFEDLIASEEAGPQCGEEVEPYFEIAIDTRQFGDDCRLIARVTAEEVTMQIYATEVDEEGNEYEAEVDSWPFTLPALWEYLRQMPRHPCSFHRR